MWSNGSRYYLVQTHTLRVRALTQFFQASPERNRNRLDKPIHQKKSQALSDTHAHKSEEASIIDTTQETITVTVVVRRRLTSLQNEMVAT